LPKGQVPPYEVHLLKEWENEPSLHCFRGRDVFCFWTPREGGATARGPGRDSQTRGQRCWVHQTATSYLWASNRRRSGTAV